MAFSDLYKQGAKSLIETGIDTTSSVAREVIQPDAMSYKAASGVTEALDPSVPVKEKEEKQEGLSFLETVGDIAMAPLRGAYEAFESTAELLTGNEYDLNPLGESRSMAGGFIEGMSQFVVGFIPGLKVAKGLGFAGKAAKAKFSSKFMKETSKHTLSTAPVARTLAKSDPKSSLAQIVGASAFSDFVAFEGQEARLSDLVQNTRLANPLTEFLQYEGNESDSEYMGRFKNVLEGALLEGLTGTLLLGFGKSIKGMKAYRDALAKGKTPKEAEKAGAQAMDKPDESLDAIDTSEPPIAKETETDFNVDDSIVTEAEKPFYALVDEAESFGINTRRKDGKYRKESAIRNELNKVKGKKLPKLKKGKRVSDQQLSEPMYLDVTREEFKNDRNEISKAYKKLKPEGAETGGKRAVLSSLLRGVKNKSQMQAIIDDYTLRSDIIKDQVEISDADFERILDNAREIDFAASGADGQTKASVDAILKGEDKEGFHEQWLRQNAASYEVMREAGEQAVGAARRWADAGLNTTDGKLYREFVDSVAMYELAVDVNAQRARRDSKALLQRRFFKQKYKNTKINPVDSKMDDLDYTKFLYERVGTKDPARLAKELSLLGSFDDLDNFARSADLAKKTSGRRLLDITQEYWINSILSGPATQLVNAVGNALTGVVLSAERGLGAVFSGNPELIRATFNLTYTFESLKEALNAAAIAFREDDSILIKGSKQFDDTSGEGTKSITSSNVSKMLSDTRLFPGKPEIADSSALGAAINGIGAGTRVFTRLLTSGDEFFKNLAYRKQIRTELAMEAYTKIRQGQGSNKTAAEILDVNNEVQSVAREMDEVAKYVEKNFGDYITESGHYMSEKGLLISARQAAEKAGKTFGKGQEKFIRNYLAKAENKFDKDATILDKIYKRSEKAAEFSELATHTSKIESDSIVEPIARILTKHPILKFVVPFLRTPANILKFGYERTPFGLLKNLRKEYRDKLRSSDPLVKADARGKLAMGTLTSGATLFYLMSGKEYITGGGPTNRDELDALKETGWQPYSIRMPNGTYISYQRLDPIATMMQMSADFRDYLKYEVRDDDDRNAAELFGAMTLVYAVNMTDKTFLRGVNNMLNVFRDPEYYGPKLFKDISAGLVPNLVNQTRNTQAEIMVKEAKDFSDTLTRRVPGLDKKVAPKRNILGEEVYRSNPLGVFGLVNPFYTSPDRKDTVFNEIAKTRHGYELPSKYLFGVRDINLEEVEANVGKYDAYDRLQELIGTVKIEGKNLRQSLKKVMGTKEYKSIPDLSVFATTGEKSPKIDIINDIISAYKVKARAQLIQENPELLERYKAALQAGAEAFTPQQ